MPRNLGSSGGAVDSDCGVEAHLASTFRIWMVADFLACPPPTPSYGVEDRQFEAAYRMCNKLTKYNIKNHGVKALKIRTISRSNLWILVVA